MPRLTTMYAGASGSHRGNNFMSGGMCNNKWQGLPATRNMRTGPILNHVRVQAYAPPADRNRIFNALGGQVLRKLPDHEYSKLSTKRFANRTAELGEELGTTPDTTFSAKTEEHSMNPSKTYAGCVINKTGSLYTYLSDTDIYNNLHGQDYKLTRGLTGQLVTQNHIKVFKGDDLKFTIRFAYGYVDIDLNIGKQFHLIFFESIPNSEKTTIKNLLELQEIGNGDTC